MKLQLQRAIALLNAKKPDTDKAMEALKPVLKKKKAPWPAYHYMGVALIQKKEYGNAQNFLKEALNRGSDEPETYHLLSMVHLELGNLQEAGEYGQEALKRRPDFFKAWLNLGSVYRAQARLDQALKCFQKANQLDPRSAGVAFRIATIYRDQGDIKKALELYDIAIKIDSEYFEAYGEKARLLQKIRKFEEAKEVLQEILDKKPNDLDARITLAEIDRAKGAYAEAISRYEEILSEHPSFAAVRVNYALALQEIGRFNESEKHYLKAFEDQSDSVESISNYLMGLHYNPDRTREEIFEAHLEWDRHFAPAERPERPEPADKDPERRLRIGLISGGFWRHPVGWMITAALENLPKDRFEIYCYTTNNLSDNLTRRIHAVTDSWKSVVGYSDEVIAGMIRDDEIDILVELSGHSADNRLRTVSLEPAPIIVKWVGGLFNTSGLRAMDYLITDWHESPEGEEPFYTEKLVRMPDDYICFLPPDYAPEVGPLPSEKAGYVIFGCFNNPTKVNPVLLEKWAQIMNRVPESRLILKSKQYDSEIFTRRIVEQMEELGIEADRLEFEGHSPHTELLDKYNEVDIALDPWPYSGGLSTCEALWMGVPVVTLPGPTFAGRHSATHLANAGLSELVVESWDEYIEKAVALADDAKVLAERRAGLREQVRRSPLCDTVRFGAHLDTALREMWKQRVLGWESGAGEWRDHIAVEAVDMMAVETAEAVDALDAGTAVETKTSEQRESGTSSTETEFGEKRTAGKAIAETLNGKEREAGEAEVETKYSEERKSGESFGQAGDSEEQKSGKPIIETEEVDKAGVDANPSGNGVQKVSGDMPLNGHVVQHQGKNGSARNDEPEVWKIETKDDVTICTPADLNMLTPYVLLEQEQWYEPELQFVRDYLKPGMNVVDVGAGFGVYALPMAQKVGPEGKVYAFEPGSLARRHLEMSKLENRFDQLEVISRAVSESSGSAVLQHGKTPEENTIVADGQGDKVNLVTLDAWWEFEGRPVVDVIKLDTNGMEAGLLAGAADLLKTASPVVILAFNGDGQSRLQAFEHLQKAGYAVYEYLKHLDLMIPHDLEAPADAYLENLVALTRDTAEALHAQGWIHDEQVKPDTPKEGYWEEHLGRYPWAVSLMEKWKENSSRPENKDYYRVVDLVCAAEADGISRSERVALLLDAAGTLIDLYNKGNAGAELSLTLARVLNMLGKRQQAVEVMQKSMQTSKMGKDVVIESPFLLPLTVIDHHEVKSSFANWMMVRSVESWLWLKLHSGFHSGEQEKKLLKVLSGNKDNSLHIKKNVILTGILQGDDVQSIQHENEFLYNKWFWKEHDDNNTTFSEKENYSVFGDAFWKESFRPAKASKVVSFSKTFQSGKYPEAVLNQIAYEAQGRLNVEPTDNVAFFILVHALLAIKSETKDRNPELTTYLKSKEWEHKEVLYNYWFDKVEFQKKLHKPQVSVIVISNKFKDDTLVNIRELRTQVKDIGEIIFVNNGKPDEEFAILREYIDTYIRLNDNAGAYLARNIGTVFSKGGILLFVDDDGIPEKKMVEAHIKTYQDRDVLAVRGVCLPKTKKSKVPWHYRPGNTIKPATILLEGNASFKSSIFFKSNGWGDYILFGHGGIELSYRMLNTDSEKQKQVYIPDSILRHDYLSGATHKKEKLRKQTVSYYLLHYLHPKLKVETDSWPQSFGVGNLDDLSYNHSKNVTPSKVRTIDFIEKKRNLKITVKIPEREIHRIDNLFKKNEYSLPDKTCFQKNITVIDVGANVGLFALYANQFAEDVNIYCFEPNPQVWPLLQENTQKYSNIKAFNVALGKSKGELTLYQHPVNTGQTSTTFKITGGKTVKVPVNRGSCILKDLDVNEIDVLKIDTEGAEVEILEGMVDYLPKTKVVMAEYHKEEHRKKIEAYLEGFILYSAEIQDLRGIGTVKYANLKYFEETG